MQGLLKISSTDKNGVVVIQNVLISTMPKSGTFYIQYFFWAYNTLLKNNGGDVDLAYATINRINTGDESNLMKEIAKTGPTMGVYLYIFHALCPGYRALFSEAWQKTNSIEMIPGSIWAQEIADALFLEPHQNPRSRVIYVYRSPLSQLYSYFRHAFNHEKERKLLKVKNIGPDSISFDFCDYIFNASALDTYIKHYLSFAEVKRSHPENILMLPYEDLMIDPGKQFERMMSFASFSAQRPEMEPFKATSPLFQKALQSVTKDEMKKLEERLGHTLGEDQVGGQGSHLRNDVKGSWKNLLQEEDVMRIEARFNEFGLSLNDFHNSPLQESDNKLDLAV